MVSTPRELTSMVGHLSLQTRFALDTESDSFFAYYPKVCLIQITTFADAHNPDAEHVVDYLVDPLRLPVLTELGELIAGGTQEVVMHAAENDILLMRRGFGFRFPRVFDTQLAARILGFKHVGLGAMLEEAFGVVSDKRMQRTDWAVRPLTRQQVAYAQMDTHYLLALRELLRGRLAAAERLEEADDAFATLVSQNGVERVPQERTFWQMKAAHRVGLRDIAVLEAVWAWREQEAQRQDRPPFKIMSDDALVELAERRPESSTELRGCASLTPQQVTRYGMAVTAAVRQGVRAAPPVLPKPTVRPELMLSPEAQTRFERLRRWRTETAQARGVAPEIVFNNDTLLEIAQHAPDTLAELRAVPGVSPWKAGAYGGALFALLNGKDAE